MQITICPMHEHEKHCYSADCVANGCTERRQKLAEAATERALAIIERLGTDQQQRVMECGMRMRELACFYGPYFRFALALTSCEIASGALIMPKAAECDRVDIMLPGGGHTPQEIILPGKTH